MSTKNIQKSCEFYAISVQHCGHIDTIYTIKSIRIWNETPSPMFVVLLFLRLLSTLPLWSFLIEYLNDIWCFQFRYIKIYHFSICKKKKKEKKKTNKKWICINRNTHIHRLAIIVDSVELLSLKSIPSILFVLGLFFSLTLML